MDTDEPDPLSSERKKEVLEHVKKLKQELDSLRAGIKAGACQRILTLADHHEALVFDAKDAYAILGAQDKQNILKHITDSMIADDATSPAAVKTAKTRVHLLALILNDEKLSIDGTEAVAQDIMSALRKMSILDGASGASYALLVASSLFAFAERIPEVPQWSEAAWERGDPAPSRPALRTLFTEEAAFYLQKVKNFLMTQADSADNETLLAVYRLLVLVTRRPALAEEFLRDGGLAALVAPMHSGPLERISGCQSYIAMILRHMVEDEAMLRYTIQKHIKSSLDSSPPRLSTAAFLGHNLGLILRDADIFTQVVGQTIQLDDFNERQGTSHVSARKEDKSSEGEEKPPSASEIASPGITQQSDTLLSFLLEEVMNSRPVIAKTEPKPAPNAASDAAATEGKPSVEAPKADDKEAPASEEQKQVDMHLFYRCFLLQIVAELVASYDNCKLSFMNFYNKKKGSSLAQSHPAATPAKLRTGVLNYFLNDLILQAASDQNVEETDVRNALALSNSAMSVIVALTADTGSNHSLKDVTPDLIAVRKHVLDGVCKVMRDVISSPGQGDARHRKFAVLTELCHRLLVAKPNDGVALRQNEDLALHLAKLMLEKNFVSVLTMALVDVDLNLPTAKRVLEKVLKPLESLTRVSTRMGRADRNGNANGSADAADSETFEDLLDGEEEDADMNSDDYDELHEAFADDQRMRDDTPDFYRNSSLGMHTGDLDAGAYDDEMSGEEMEDEEDVEMEEYDSEDTGSDLR